MFSGLSNLLRFGGSNLPMSQPVQPMPVRMPVHYPGAFNPQPMGGVQPVWGSSPQMWNGAAFNTRPAPMPAPTRFPQFNSQINLGAQSQMRPARPAY